MMTSRKPNVVQFEKAVATERVSQRQKKDFRAYLDRLPIESPERQDAEAVWAEYVRRGERVFEPPQNPPSRADQDRGPRGPRQGDEHRRGGGARARATPPAETAARSTPANRGPASASASVLGQPFHNPYTFLPFDPEPPVRRTPTPLTVDEHDRDRVTGVLELTIEAVSPLLTSHAVPKERTSKGHPTYEALRIGGDVIVPATGIRGALRSVLSILTSGTLGYVDDELWLTQGRDARLGPRSENAPDPSVPVACFLAEVVEPGGRGRRGRVRLGRARLLAASSLGEERSVDERRPRQGGIPGVYPYTDHGARWDARPKGPNDQSDLLRLSGRPINRKGKREGVLPAVGSRTMDLPEHLWLEYQGRHRHADFPELRKGHIVWLEPASPDLPELSRPEDVRSIQWARWGRHGDHLLHLLREHHPGVLPDALRNDGLVDEVTDLFGQIPSERGAAGPFAARVRPENLVFRDAKTTRATLAPLVAPHPGCRAFYRRSDPSEPGRLMDSLRGYKVYRNTSERGAGAPWHYAQQGIYADDGVALKEPQQKINRTVELLDPNQRGELRLALRALSRRELSLLLAACTVDWRLGGGKPLGLGHCRVVEARLVSEEGATLFHAAAAPFELPDDLRPLLGEKVMRRLHLWRAAQVPVPRLRYPRAVDENRNRKQRGGHVWFQRHASPAKGDSMRLQVTWLHESGPLRQLARCDALAGQVLPEFDQTRPEADLLYGYDMFLGEDEGEWGEQGRDRRRNVKKLELFDSVRHARGSDASGGPQGQSEQTRQNERSLRRNAHEQLVPVAPRTVAIPAAPALDERVGQIHAYDGGPATIDVGGEHYRVQVTRLVFKDFDGPLDGRSLGVGRRLLVVIRAGQIVRVRPG